MFLTLTTSSFSIFVAETRVALWCLGCVRLKFDGAAPFLPLSAERNPDFTDKSWIICSILDWITGVMVAKTLCGIIMAGGTVWPGETEEKPREVFPRIGRVFGGRRSFTCFWTVICLFRVSDTVEAMSLQHLAKGLSQQSSEVTYVPTQCFLIAYLITLRFIH